MTIVFSDPFNVHYGQFELHDTAHDDVEWETLQACGVGVVGVEPGAAILLTARHTGNVGLTVSFDDRAPAPDESYDDIVEIDFRSTTPALYLVTWECEELELPDLPRGRGNYRMRYHGRGAAAADPGPMELDEIVDDYLLQIWPAAPAVSRVVKSTSGWLNYWLKPPSSARGR